MSEFKPQFDSAPDHLKHQPVLALPYEKHDGNRAEKTDAKFLTIGWAQWNPDKELSAKVLRFVGEKWSRQSEELPLTRAIDLAALVAIAFRDRDAKAVELPAGFLENQDEPVHLDRLDGVRFRGGFAQALEEDEVLRRRLGRLADVLADLRERGAI